MVVIGVDFLLVGVIDIVARGTITNDFRQDEVAVDFVVVVGVGIGKCFGYDPLVSTT
jgi:hypothetical protein